ncbi:Metallothiol transferase FosB [Bacillus sp. CECT 9360]|nr:Metallothiol transferase FosB [Bacillus sp. CECT 9360]
MERPEKAEQSDSLGVDHVAFFIDEAEFDQAARHLQNNGIRIIRGPEKRGIGSSVYFRDPDGTQLELHTSTLAERMTVWK